MQQKYSLHQECSLLQRIQYSQHSLPRDENRHFNLSGPTPLKWSFNFLSDPEPSGARGRMRSSQLLCWAPDPLPSSPFLSRSALRAPRQLPAPIPLLERPFPLQPGPDIRNWLRKCSNGYQIFGNCLSFWELNMCSVQHPPAPLDLTAAFDLLIFLSPFFFFLLLSPLSLKKQENFYQITHDVNAKLCCEMTANMLFSRCLTRQ